MPERLLFKNRAAFRGWLRKNHAQSAGIWLTFGKNDLLKTLHPEDALEEALCFGWIDGLIKSADETQYLKYFSRRRQNSNWSEKNKKTVERLIKQQRMAPPGLKAIETAKRNGSWISRQRPVVTQKEIERFAQAIAGNPRAAGNFQKMPQSVKRQFAGFFLEAKKEATRQTRLEKLIGLIEQNKRPM